MNNAERLADNTEEVFGEFVGDRGVTDSELVDFILATPEVYTALVTAWMSQDKLKQKVLDWMNEVMENDDREDR